MPNALLCSDWQLRLVNHCSYRSRKAWLVANFWFGGRAQRGIHQHSWRPQGWMSVGYALKGFWLSFILLRCPSSSPSIQHVAFFFFFKSGLTQGHVPARLGQRSGMAIWETRVLMLLLRTTDCCREQRRAHPFPVKRWWLCWSLLTMMIRKEKDPIVLQSV
jgi:hypothetical protein